MKTYTGYVSNGYVGCKRTFTFTMEDDATEEEIEEAFEEELWNVIEVGYFEND